jgi:DNA-binding winged helix-turn-helix (wHTH) protein/Tol biopolymer transport system component
MAADNPPHDCRVSNDARAIAEQRSASEVNCASPVTYSFLDLTLDLSAERLMRGTTEIRLRPKSFQVLRYLVERGGSLVTREELLDSIWRDVVVTDESITKCIADIRKALNDDAQQVIRTVARRGYVFVPPVTQFAAPAQASRDSHAFPSTAAYKVAHDVSAPVRHIRARWAWAAALTLLTAAVGTSALVFRATRSEGGPAPSVIEYTQLTNFTNAAFAPALSRDGRMLAFIRGENPSTIFGAGDVFVKMLPDGEPVQLTHDGRPKLSPAFTPGDDRVTYAYSALMTTPEQWSTWTVSVFGGDPQPLLSNASGLTWMTHSNPARVLFSRVDTGTHMSIVSSIENGTDSRVVYAPATVNGMAHRSYLSPDGKNVIVISMDAGWRPCRVVPFDATQHGTPPVDIGREVGPTPGQCSGAAWSPDGRWVYLSVNTGSGYHIWRQRFPAGTPEQVTFGATEEQEIAFAPDGRSFVTSIGTRQSTLWVHDQRGDRQITSEGYASLPRFSPDGTTLYYLQRSRSNRRYVSGELWTADVNSGKRERLFDDFLLADYSMSRDGKQVLLVAIAEDGATSVWIADVDRPSTPRRVTTANADRVFFGTGDDVIFVGVDEMGRRFLNRVPRSGGNPEKAFPEPVIYVYDVSPDGHAAAVWRGAGVEIVSLHGAGTVTVSVICAAAGGDNRGTTPPCVSWAPDGELLSMYDRTAGHVYVIPLTHEGALPRFPHGGFASGPQIAELAGVRDIHEPTAFPSRDPSTYAFFHVTTQRNIYRVRVPDERR